MDDAATAARIYSMAVGTSLLESSQSADQLASRIKNLTDVQKNFLDGTLSSQDFFNFVQQNAELFEDEDFFESFQSGASLSRFLIQELEDQFENFRTQLIATESQIRRYDRMLETANEEEKENIINLRNAAIAQRNQLLIMNEHRGILHNTTRELIDYNVAQKAFNNLKRIGVSDLESQTRALEALQESTANSLRQVSERLNSTQEGINAALDGADPSIYFEIVDGVVRVTDAFADLSIAQQQVLEGLFEALEGGYEDLFDVFKTLMDETIAMEEAMANERIKVYEDYFAALDRLEKQRERKVQREDLVTQLSRLESATDERSRRRALELRRELNQMDEDGAKETIQEGRASLLQSISDSVERIRETFINAFQDFREAGGESAEALFDTLQSRGLIRPNGS
jgi:hypothetical protein